jgi:CubicO group peptidase (beta-lactamase class C family)
MTLSTTILELQQNSNLPGCVVAYQYGYDDPVIQAFGTDGIGDPLSPGSVFPVASVTKLAMALAILHQIDCGIFNLDDTVEKLLDDINPEAGKRTIRQLLSHTSGYGMDVTNKEGRHSLSLTWELLRADCFLEAPVTDPYMQVQYSNLAYIILGAVLEKVTGLRCADALSHTVLRPLGIRGWLGYIPDVPHANIGDIRGIHRGTELETFNSPFWRSLELPSGGLCTDAAGTLTLTQSFQSSSGFLSHQIAEAATSDQTRGLPGGFMKPLWWEHSSWGLGPELRGAKTPHWIDSSFPANSFGHSGASGMIAWTDPDNRLSLAILGARAADGGWLLRHGPILTRALRQEVGLL